MSSIRSVLILAIVVGFRSAVAAEPPALSVGLGLRGAFRDPATAVVAARVTLLDTTFFEGHPSTLSVRPKVLLGSYLEVRLPLVFELAATPHILPFVGLGAAYNTDDFGHVDHMYSFGSDIVLTRRLGLSVVCNLIYQDHVPDRDTEAMLTLNLTL